MLNIYRTGAMKDLNKEDQEYNPHFKENQIKLFKHHLFVGGTGLGKTNAVINLILALDGCFRNIQIYTADPSEKLYKMLKDKLKDKITIEEIHKIPKYSTQQKNGQQLLVVDDFIEQPKAILQRIEEYATQARKKLFTCCFLTQSYFDCPKKIRLQIRYIVLLKLCDKRNFGAIVSGLDTDIPNEIIRKIIKNATAEDLNICVIDKQTKDINKLFRRNYGTDYYIVEDATGNEIDNVEMFHGSGIIN